MNRKEIMFVLATIIVAAGFVQAANIYWAEGASGLWTDGTNWVGGAPPQDGDTPYLDRNNITVTVTDAVNNTFLEFKGPGHGTNIANAVLNIDGGYIRVLRGGTNETFRIAYSSGTSGRINMTGGVIEVGDFDNNLGDFQVGRSGIGELFMTGGEIRVARYLSVGAASGGTGHVKIYGDAEIHVGEQLFRSSTGNTRIDIADDGKLIFGGHKGQHVVNWNNWGYLVAYDEHPDAQIMWDYDEELDITTAWAVIPEPATIGLLSLGMLFLKKRNSR